MKLPKIKNKKIIKRTLTWGAFFVAGFMTHVYLNPAPSGAFPKAGAPSVSVQTPERLDLTEKKKFIAEVESINSVNIVPQVAGYLEEVRFNDGSFVQEGDILFVIEQTKFKANVESAEAALEKAKSYQSTMSMSKNAIYKQLISEYGEKFEESEAQYAIDHLDD